MYHRLTIAGNLGKDPELKFTPDGKAICTFSLAASNRKDETAWFRVTVWGSQAETAEKYLHKGSKVLVEGRLQSDAGGNPRTYERKDGGWAASYEVLASAVKFLSGKDELADQEIAF